MRRLVSEPVMLTFHTQPDTVGKGDNEIQDPHPIPYGRFPYFGHYYNLFRVWHETVLLCSKRVCGIETLP